MGHANDVRQQVQQAIAALAEVTELLDTEPVDWESVQSLLLRARGWLQVAHASALTGG